LKLQCATSVSFFRDKVYFDYYGDGGGDDDYYYYYYYYHDYH